MSEEQLKAFIAKVQADASLQEQLRTEGADVVAIAKAAGFSITTEDLNSHRQNLSDDELEGVAGGGGGCDGIRITDKQTVADNTIVPCSCFHQ
ncbi:hypothetical [Prochlorococcus marinus str. MIT 9313]|uniref:Nif11 domain-containing protein n=1 Tax=Prochlorococcus marinus (strain MIT 9313) TaxID=74547 RepID=Q7V7C0_PROMM|nr:Nif11-like leader peptide family natural product precursor [Prochlorococcus marinus]CAE21004.1 hypothetical [Prochlorococcus marinus str. MIT 9313]